MTKSKGRVWTLPRLGRAEAVNLSTETRPAATMTAESVRPTSDHRHLNPLKVTPVYDSYWCFAAKRQHVYMQRAANKPGPWTDDPIIAVHKFTNAYRASDRVSQYLIRHVIYRDDLPNSAEEVLFRVLMFKLFNKIETWEMLERAFGAVTLSDYKFKHYDSALTRTKDAGSRIYSAAYIMPPGGTAYGHVLKHQNHLKLLEQMIDDKLAAKLGRVKRMQDGFELLKGYPTIGDFLAYQFIIDVNYSELTDFSEMEFVVPGPGAKDGLRKCFSDSAGLNEAELIRFMADRQADEFGRLGLVFEPLWGRPLQLIDCQNIFCETDKYARVAHPEIAGISGRSRIKQKFVSSGDLAKPWYPPKWNLNDRIAADVGRENSESGRPVRAKAGSQLELSIEEPFGAQ